ncbi:PREDICTED: uncharacterized protein LOC106099549 [Papilio polytes]|uniref:uncharacterized protein LOC106099549 n=1 Tax=Papilio polytes TaxID=76194 RepID=UPI00067657F7|nr:PREDICTED: uncharacterized protein LOC106099549 [Papilio polytes]
MSKEFWIARRDVTYEQLYMYLKLTRSLPGLYLLAPSDSRTLALDAYWDTCAKKLNAVQGGTVKSATGWSQYLHYVRFRVKQRITEITTGNKISRVPEDDYIPTSEVDRMINIYLTAIEDDNSVPYEFDPTKSRFWETCVSQSSAPLKRRLSASDIVIPKRIKQMPDSEDAKYENAEGNLSAGSGAQPIPKRRPRRVFVQACKTIKYCSIKKPMKKSSGVGLRGRKLRCIDDSSDFDIEVPPSLRRSQSFTDLSDAIEHDRKVKLEIMAERIKTDPVSVKKREEERVNYVRFVSLLLRACLIDSFRILSYTSVLREILNNNPQFQKTISDNPTIF